MLQSNQLQIIRRGLILRDRQPPKPGYTVKLEPHEMHWQIISPDGKIVREAEQPVHNLVLNNAKELVATYGFSNQSNYAVVGTGSTAPAAGQVGLVAEVARTNTIPGGEADSTSRTADGVYEIRRVRQFSAAQVGGQNLTEWAFSGAAVAGNNIMCRELFRDGGNNPITITLAADQQLRLIYKVRVTVGPVVATAASINIANIGNRTGKLITYRAGSNNGPGDPDKRDLYLADALATTGGSSQGMGLKFLLRTGGLTLTYPTNTNGSSWTLNKDLGIQAYTPGSKKRKTSQIYLTSSEAVVTIKGFGIGYFENFGTYTAYSYFEFDAGQEVTKDNLHELCLDPWEINWS